MAVTRRAAGLCEITGSRDERRRWKEDREEEKDGGKTREGFLNQRDSWDAAQRVAVLVRLVNGGMVGDRVWGGGGCPRS